MPRWKPKSTQEKFRAELEKLDAKIKVKRSELVSLEHTKKQLEMVINALQPKTDNKKVEG